MRKITENPFFFFSFIACAVLFSLFYVYSFFVFAVLFLLLYVVFPYAAYRLKCNRGLRKIQKLCEKNGYTFLQSRIRKGQTCLSVQKDGASFSVLMVSSFYHAKCMVTVEDEATLSLVHERAGTVAFSGLHGYSMNGTTVRRTTVIGPSGQRVFQNFPASRKIRKIMLQVPPSADNVEDILIIYPPMCEIFCRQKGEIELGTNGMRVGRWAVYTLGGFCDYIANN